MTNRNFTSGPDRGNKLVNLRGLKGAHLGPAGPCKHVVPTETDQAPPIESAFAKRYARYANAERREGRMPTPPLLWLAAYKAKGRKPRRKAIRKSAALIAHQRAPYHP